MSLKDKLAGGFKNVGHMIAVGAKYFEKGVELFVVGAAKVQVAEPEVDLIVGALAGPQAAAIADLSFHALGDIAAALEHVNDDAIQAVAEKGLVINTDAQTLQDIKKLAAVIKGLFKAQGAAIPTV